MGEEFSSAEFRVDNKESEYMVGLIHKILFDLIEGVGGTDAVQEIKRRASVELEREFRMDTAYADDEWQRLLKATCEVLKLTPEQAYDAYADAFCRDAMRRFPQWFKMSKSSYDFLKRQPVIHNSFATGVRDPEARKSINDKFRLETKEREIITHYNSPNQLCGLYKSLARWMVKHYGDEAVIEEVRCLKDGAPECEIHVRWSKVAS